MDCKSYLYNGIEIPNNEESKAKFMLAFNAQKRDENSVTILNNVNYGTTVTINGVEMILYDKKPVENIEGFQLYKYKLTPNNIVDKKLPTIKLNEDNIIIPSETMSESDFFETYPNGIVVSSQLSINPNKDLIDNNTITNPFNSTTLFEKWINSENGNIVKFEESNPNSLNIVIVGDKDPQLVKKFYKEEDKTVYLYTSKDNKETSNVINVYSSDKNGFQNLSNFLNGPIFILEKNKNEDEKQITYPTVEHYYQYRKAVFAGDLEAMTKILLAETGYKAQKIGKDIKNLNPEKWDEVSKDILRTTMLIAFAQNKENRDLLLSTGNAEFTHVSNTGAILGKWTEDFPKLLKEVRDIIRNTESFINHSGGADGGDINWDFIGCQFGFHNNIHYYTGEKSSKNAPYGNTIISDIDYEEGRVEAAKAAKRNFGYELDRMKDERLIRNWSQVKYSDAIFAVSNIVDKGGKLFPNLKDDSRVALLPAVTGGTGYAVGMAIIHDKPVYVFNQEANNKYSIGWYTWSEDIQDFVKIDTPILTENYAGIGSRELTKEGKEAIKNVFKKATDILNSKVSNVKEEAIQLETPEQIYKDLPKKTESGHVKLKPWEDLKEAEQAIVIASDKLFNPNDKVLKKGSVVKYDGIIYLFWSKSKSGQAQLIDMNGNKFSGTPNIDKLTVLGSYQTTMYNNTEYIVTDKDNIYSGASGKKVFADEEKTSKSRKDIILNLAKSNLPQSSYIISTRIRNSTEHFGNPFTHEPKGKTPGLIEVNSIEEAVERYIEWVLFDHNKDNLLEASKEVQAALNNPKFKEQRDWIRKQLQSGQLKGLDILYFTELKKPSHANALDYLINQYDWNRKEDSNLIVEITKSKYTRRDVQNNLDTAYVFTENTHSITAFPNRQGDGSAIIRPELNAFAIVTKKKYDYNTRENVNYSDTESDFKEFVDVNTRLIQELKNSGKSKIVFPQGFATHLAKMPTRFAEWLQKELYNNFGLVTELNNTKTGLISVKVENSIQINISTSTSLPSVTKPIDNQWYIYDRNQKKFIATTQSALPDRYRGIINSDLNNSTIEVINELTKKFNLENYRLTVLKKLKSKLYPLLADRDMSKILFDIIYPNKIQINDVGQHTFTYNNRTIKTDIPLDPSQEKALIRAIRLINGQQYGNKGHTKIITIQGMPGTGKTTIIGYLQKYFSKDTDNNFVYMAPTHSASAELAFSTVKTGNTQLPFTIASSFTYHLVNGKKAYTFHNRVLALLSSYMKRIIVIDECSMIPDSEMEKLIKAAEYSGAFIIFLGDKKQNPPIEDSKDKDKKKYISKSLTDFETIDLEEVHRTSDINGLSLLYNTRQLTSFKLYSIQTDNIKFYPRNSAHLHFQRVIDSYRKDPDGTIYITYTNSVVKEYNRLIRNELNGSIDENIKVGDLIMGYQGYSNKKISEGHLANSMKYEVKGVQVIDSYAVITAESKKLNNLIEAGIENISAFSTFLYYPLSGSDIFFKSTFTKEDFENNNKHLSSIFRQIHGIDSENISEESKIKRMAELMEKLALINVGDKYIYNPTTDRMELYKYDTHKDLKTSGIGSLLLDRGVDYGYAITAQKSQGSNYRRVFVDLSKLDSAGNTPIYDDEDNIVTTNKLAQFYVMASRFQIELHVFQDIYIPTQLSLSIEVQIGEEILKDNKPYIVYNTKGLTANVFSKNTKEKIIVSLSEIKSNNKIYLVNDNEIIIDETISLSLNGDLIEKQVDIVENEIENKFAEDIEFEDVIDVPKIKTNETLYEYSDGSEISDLGHSLSESNLNILSAMLDAVISEENKFTLEGDNMIDRTIMADIFITNAININEDFENYLYIVPNELMKSNSNIYNTITLNELDIQDVKMIVIDSYELFTQEGQEIIDNIDNNIFKLILTDSNNNTINTLRDRVLNYENEVLNNIIEDLENDNIEISDITTTSSSTGNIVVLKNKQQLKELKERDMYIIVEEKNYENNNRLLQTLEITPKYIVGNRVHLENNIDDIETSEFRTINNPFPNISYIEGYSIKLEYSEKSIFVVEVNIEFANQFKLLSGQEQLEFKKKYFIPLNPFDIDNNIDLDYIITIDRLLGTYENELIIISDFNNKDWFIDVLENVRHNVFILKNEFSRLDVLLNYPYLSDISKAILTNEQISKGFKDNLIFYLDWNNYLPNENEDQLNEEDLQSIIDTDITKDSVIDFDIDPNMDTNLFTEEHKNKILKFITCKPQ